MFNDISKLETPCYIYNKSIISKQISSLKEIFKETKIYYSAKANSNLKILKTINSKDLFIDVASIGELKLALEAGFSAEKISYIGPAKSKKDLEEAIKLNIREIIVESREEINRIIILNKKLTKNQKIIIRVNPNLITKESSLTMSGRPSQFGIDQVEIDLIAKDFKEKIDIVGLHFYSRSQIFNVEELIEQFKCSIELSLQIEKKHKLNFDRVNIGGGIPIAYYESQKHLDGKELSVKYINLLKSYTLGFSLSIESGRFIVAPSGQFVTKVEYLKESQGKNYVIVDGGFSCNASLVGVGQILKQNFKCSTSSKEKITKIYSVAGPSCTPLDILAQNIELPVLSEGDFLYFENSGAYGLSYSPNNFLELKEAQEYFIE
jgi:diaminopimelate decarboxylase